MARESTTQRGTRLAGILCSIGLVLVIGFGVAESLVWDLVTMSQGTPIGEIYRQLGAIGTATAVGPIMVWAGIGLVLTAAFAVSTQIKRVWIVPFGRTRTIQRTIGLAIWIAGLGMVAQWFAFWTMGLYVSDDVAQVPNGGSTSLETLYNLIGCVAMLVGPVLVFVPALRRRPRSPVEAVAAN